MDTPSNAMRIEDEADKGKRIKYLKDFELEFRNEEIPDEDLDRVDPDESRTGQSERKKLATSNRVKKGISLIEKQIDEYSESLEVLKS